MIRLIISTLCISAWLWFGEIFPGESSVVKEDRATGWVCQVQGKIYHEGDKFTINNPCLLYECRFGLARVIKYGCHYQNRCLELDDQVVNNCVTQQCFHDSGGVGFKTVKYGCKSASKCIGLGESYTDGCYNFACEKITVDGNFYLGLKLKTWGCYYDSKCYKENEIVVHNCVTKRCEKRGFTVGMFDTNRACKHGSKCYMLNETYVDRCHVFTCKMQHVAGMMYYGAEPTGVLCQDSDGNCHKSGEVFTIGINNNLHHNCTCIINGLQTSYMCA